MVVRKQANHLSTGAVPQQQRLGLPGAGQQPFQCGDLILLAPFGQGCLAVLQSPVEGQANTAVVEYQDIVSLMCQPVHKAQVVMLLDAGGRAKQHGQAWGGIPLCAHEVAMQGGAVRTRECDGFSAVGVAHGLSWV